MKALVFDGTLRYVTDAPIPQRDGEALVKVLCAGICNTDLEIIKGYAGFRGILGHEFVGLVQSASQSHLIGKRVVGEINAGCGTCDSCKSGDSRHCPARTTLGIAGREGAFAEYLSLPAKNLLPVPDNVSNEEAVFVEPLAAACRILEQITINSKSKVAVIGDGKLGQLIIRVLAQTGCELILIGNSREKLDLASGACRQCVLRSDLNPSTLQDFDIAIEASGSPSGLTLAADLLKPRGTLVLKSTHHGSTPVDTSKIVVNELTILGSRCGMFGPAIAMLEERKLDVHKLISGRFPIEKGLDAFELAGRPGIIKVIIDIDQQSC